MKKTGFKYFISQIISLVITLTLIGLKITNTIDISWFYTISPMILTLLGPFILMFFILIWVSFIMLFKKKDTRKKFKKDIFKIFRMF